MLMAVALFTPAITATIQKRAGALSTVLLYVAGAVFLVVAIFWTALTPILGIPLVASIERIAGDFRVWLFVVSLLWLYVAVATVVHQNRKIETLNSIVQSNAMIQEKLVLPRRLTQDWADRVKRVRKF